MPGKPEKQLTIKARIELEVRDNDGKLIHKHSEESHSWVSNFLKALRGLVVGGLRSKAVTLTATDGSTFSYPNLYSQDYQILDVNAGAGAVSYGLLLGIGTAAVSPDDYNLATKITNGTGTNQMNYGGTTIEGLTAITDGYQFRIIRTATNNSGAAITVSEIGLVARTRNATNVYYYFLIARDVLATPVTVNDGQTLTVRYIISFTV